MKITRRDFLKGSLVGTAGIAGAGAMPSVLQAMRRGRNIPLQNTQLLESSATICMQCNAHCGVSGFLESNQLVSLYGNPAHPNSRGKICAKGMAAINEVYDPERLLYPLRRTGKRGEGKWKKISWDEAYEEIAQAFRKSMAEKKWLFLEVGRDEVLTGRFLGALSSDRIYFRETQGDSNARKARALTWGADQLVPDLLHATYILNFGSNPYENHEFYVPVMERLVEAQNRNRAKLVTIDVRLSHTASLSDQWVPIVPGTDAIVALTMAHVIMSEGLADLNFLDTWTNVSSDALSAYLARYTLEKAEAVSGIPKGEIERIAREFAQNTPALALAGGGITEHVNGTQNERCIMLLNAVKGNIDQRGGCLLPRRLHWEEPLPRPPEPALVKNAYTVTEAVDRARQENSTLGLYLGYLSNPAFSSPQCEATAKLLKNQTTIPRLIIVDTHMSETALLADLVLPAATFLESWSIESPPSFDLVPFLALRQPIMEQTPETEALRSTRTTMLTESVMKPRGEAVAWGDVLTRIAQRMGGEVAHYFPFDTTEEYVEKIVGQFELVKEQGGLHLLKVSGVWMNSAGKIDYGSYRKKGFSTPSGKFELFSTSLEALGVSPLPAYEPLKPPQSGEFFLVPFSPSAHTSRTANSSWLAELAHENPLWINVDTGQSLGIKEGDRVNVSSEAASIIAKAHLTAGVHPQVVAISQEFGHWGYGSIAQGKHAKSHDRDTHAVWWEGNGVNPNAIIQLRRDPVGGGLAWKDTMVKISKA